MTDILATLTAMCDHHTDQVVGRWHLVALPGGRTLVWSDLPANREHLVALEGQNRITQNDGSIVWTDDDVREDVTGHFREILTCPKPSCGYKAQLRLRPFRDNVRRALEGLVDAGRSELIVTRIDTPPSEWKPIRPVR